MLVLSRKAGQRIQIGDDVFVTVTVIKGNRVALGIEAPSEVAVRRGELLPLTSSEKASTANRDQEAKQVA